MLRFLAHGWRNFNHDPDRAPKRLNWEFYVVLEGQCALDLKMDGSKPQLASSTLWLLPPRMRYLWKGDDKPCLRLCLHLANLPQLMESSLPSCGYYQTPITKEQGLRIAQLIQELESVYYHPDPTYELRITGLTSELCLIALQQTQFKKETPHYLLAANRVRQAENWYLEHLYKSPGVQEVAIAIGLSISQLRRHFQLIRQRSPKQVFQTLRLNRACMLLAATDHTISYIAEHSGFTSKRDLHRAFKEHYAITPHFWRTNTKDGLDQPLVGDTKTALSPNKANQAREG